MKNRYNLLSLCQKAGALVSGEFATMEAIKAEKACLVLVAEDASENTKKRFQDKANYRGIPVMITGKGEELGRAIGKSTRTSIAITDKGFAESIRKKMEEIE